MLDAHVPVFAHVVSPTDRDAMGAGSPLQVTVLSATYAMSPALRGLCAAARKHGTNLLVDPKTPYFQYEGYLSMEAARALPYSPGRGTLAVLWTPNTFARVERRAELIDAVFSTQLELDADYLMAPYFVVRRASQAWLEIARDTTREAVSRSRGKPVSATVCVELDAILEPQERAVIADAFDSLGVDLYTVILPNFDERDIAPNELTAVLDLLDRLRSNEVPVLLLYTGRSGLVAISKGATGYGAGSVGTEHLPLRHYREGYGSQQTNLYYLHEGMVSLPARLAEVVLEAWHGSPSPPCDCPGCSGAQKVGLMVSRRLAIHALHHRTAEIAWIASHPAGYRQEVLRERLKTALERFHTAAEVLARKGGPPALRSGHYHYLEVLLELVGGPAARIPDTDSF